MNRAGKHNIVHELKDQILYRAHWKDDCLGKQNYDMPLVSVDSRYWPDNKAIAGIWIGDTEVRVMDDYARGRSKEHTQRLVELWVEATIKELLHDLIDIGWITKKE